MARINLSARDFDAFIALADCRHFTRAAERCHLSQSAFSQLIRRIEQAAGARLFERSTRHVTLTPEGEVFAEQARRIAAEIRTAVSDLREHAAVRKGRIGITALPSLAAEWLPALLTDYRKRYPGVTVELFDVLADRCLEFVRTGRADFALTAVGADLKEFDAKPILTDRYYLVCRRDHRLAARKSVRPRDLAGERFVFLARGTSVRQHLEPLLRGLPHTSSGLEVEQLATLAGLVEAGDGISVVPELTLFHFHRPSLVTIPVAAKDLARPIYVVRSKGRALSAAAAAMLALIEERAALNRGRRVVGRAHKRHAAGVG
jgi:DNA-binding transcriptional LysR family regulator